MANEPNKNPFGVGHDGRPKAVINVHPGMSVSHDRHMPGRQIEHDVHVAEGMKRTYSGGIDPRVGAVAKHQGPVPVHGAMAAKSRRTGEHFDGVGGDGISRYDADPGTNPTLGPPVGKRLTEPAITPTMRSRTSPGLTGEHFRMLGKLLLSTATASPDDKAALAHYGIGTLPSSTTEN
ncbi:MAG TPA: hypothetical protein VL048_03775 [Xanthobacteraceae bacterium]|nr:hypothetical protein [Xanthobacteraceae bacterium]